MANTFEIFLYCILYFVSLSTTFHPLLIDMHAEKYENQVVEGFIWKSPSGFGFGVDYVELSIYGVEKLLTIMNH